MGIQHIGTFVKYSLVYVNLWVWFSNEGKGRWGEMQNDHRNKRVSRKRNWRCRIAMIKVKFLWVLKFVFVFYSALKTKPYVHSSINGRIDPLTAWEATHPATRTVS